MKRTLLTLSLLVLVPMAAHAQHRGEARQPAERTVAPSRATDTTPAPQRAGGTCEVEIRFEAEAAAAEGGGDSIRVPVAWHVLGARAVERSGQSDEVDAAVRARLAELDRDGDGTLSEDELRAVGSTTEPTVSIPFTLQSDDHCPR